MLPCGRYYYEPEGGYVGNSWIKFSLQYIYLYMFWFIHHLDLIDHYIFQFFQTLIRKCVKLYKKNIKLFKKASFKFNNFNPVSNLNLINTFKNANYNFKIKK
jgi:hypothetical protein